MSETLLQPESSYKVFILPDVIKELGFVAGFIFGRLMIKTNCGLHSGLLSNSELLSNLNIQNKHTIIKAKNVLKEIGLIFLLNEDNPRSYEYGINIHHNLYKKVMGEQARTETELTIPEWCKNNAKNLLSNSDNTSPSSDEKSLHGDNTSLDSDNTSLVTNCHLDSDETSPYHYIHNNNNTNNTNISNTDLNKEKEKILKEKKKDEDKNYSDTEVVTAEEISTALVPAPVPQSLPTTTPKPFVLTPLTEQKQSRKRAPFVIPDLNQVLEHMRLYVDKSLRANKYTALYTLDLERSADDFMAYYSDKGWKIGNVQMKDWRSTAERWLRSNMGKSALDRKLTNSEAYIASLLRKGVTYQQALNEISVQSNSDTGRVFDTNGKPVNDETMHIETEAEARERHAREVKE